MTTSCIKAQGHLGEETGRGEYDQQPANRSHERRQRDRPTAPSFPTGPRATIITTRRTTPAATEPPLNFAVVNVKTILSSITVNHQQRNVDPCTPSRPCPQCIRWRIGFHRFRSNWKTNVVLIQGIGCADSDAGIAEEMSTFLISV